MNLILLNQNPTNAFIWNVKPFEGVLAGIITGIISVTTKNTTRFPVEFSPKTQTFQAGCFGDPCQNGGECILFGSNSSEDCIAIRI